MPFLKRFTKLMKSEPPKSRKNRRNSWIIDENKCLTFEEVNELRSHCNLLKLSGLENRKFADVRSWMMVELGLNAGLRVAEMASLKTSNLLIDNGRSSIVVIGKGEKERAIWISSEFKARCEEYLGYKKEFGYGTAPEDYLLNSLKGGKITKRALQKFFKRILEDAKLPARYHIHCLRHTYTTFLLKASNNNYRFAQQQLGHASIKTTQTYAGVIESEGRKAVERLY